MAHSLEQFEERFSEDVLMDGEDLFHAKAISDAKEIERHLWEFLIEDGSQFEVEVLISPSKIKKYSCDCDEFADTSECKHIIAALYYLRTQIAQKKEKKAKRKKASQLPLTVRVKDIFPLVKNDELRTFLNYQLRNDNKLALKFKSRFAQKIKIAEGRNKYLQILDELIKPVTDVKRKMSGDKINLFLQLADEFLDQYGDLLSLQQFAESYELMSALIQKTAYVHTYSTVFEDKVKKTIHRIHMEWWNYYSSVQVPALKEKQVMFSTELASHSYYNYTNKDNDLYQFIFANSSFVREDLLDAILIKIKRVNTAAEDSSYLISAFFKLIIKINNDEILSEIKNILGYRPELISRILEIFSKDDDYIHMEAFIQFLDDHGFTKQLDLTIFKIRLLIQMGEQKRAAKMILEEYIHSFKPILIQHAYQLDKEEYKIIFERLEDYLKKIDQIGKLKEFYKETKQYDKLLELIEKEPNIESLDKYSPIFWNNYEQRMIDLHIESYTDYLKSHMGYINSQFIGQQIDKIKRKGHIRAARLIKEAVYDRYPGRKSLKEVFRNV